MKIRRLVAALASLASLVAAPALAGPPKPAPAAAAVPSAEECKKLVTTIDENERRSSDFKVLVQLEHKESGKPTLSREVVIYNRETEKNLLLLFTKPKTEQGKGYLVLERNLWFYDPSVGKWDRTTDRERIGGTNTRRSDFEAAKYGERFDYTCEGEKALGKQKVQAIKLQAKEGVDVAFPVMRLFVDPADGRVLKREEYALSNKLLRSSYFNKFRRFTGGDKKEGVLVPEESRYFDEVVKGADSMTIIKGVDMNPIEANTFTKAWLEGKSR